MKKELINYEIPENTDEDVVHNWEPLKKTIDSSFKYEHKNIFYKIFSIILYYIRYKNKREKEFKKSEENRIYNCM